jgi:hypothetical protein
VAAIVAINFHWLLPERAIVRTVKNIAGNPLAMLILGAVSVLLCQIAIGSKCNESRD